MERKKVTFDTFAKQLGCISKYKKKYLFIILILNMIFTCLIPFISALLPKVAIGLIEGRASDKEVIMEMCLLGAISFVCLLISTICSMFQQTRFLEIRVKEFSNVTRRLQKMEYSNLEDAKKIDRFNESIEALGGDYYGFEGAYHNLFEFLPFAFATVLYSVVLFIFNYWIAICALVGGVVTIIINSVCAKYAASLKDEEAKAYKQAQYFQNISFDFSYGKDIRVYSLQDKLKRDFRNKSINLVNVFKKMINHQFTLGLIELIFLLLQDAVSYFFIIKAYYDGYLSLGEVSFYVGLIIALSTAIRSASEKFTSMIQNMRLSVSYFEFMEDRSLLESSEGREALDKNETLEIEFRNVSFKYPSTSTWIFKNLNLTIHKGEKLAIVGTNGAGKTTICKLMIGLFEPTEGQILINGIDIKDFSKRALYDMYSIVFQDVNIFACSIIENVTGEDNSSSAREKAIECLNRVGLKEKIESLPNKYDTQMLKILDDEGVELSGGQNQKIAIARALYKDANMVILDEPTASLDALAEASIYQSFDDLVKNKTAIYISHRLSSTKFCDKIALFTQNGLEEYGNHEELMAKKGIYYSMFMTQGKYYKEGGEENE
ncbi:MAG: ABC transporter ATP-binding protein [Bacilli bacterium]